MSARDVLITGIGLVSSLGEGCDAHWRRLTAPRPEPVLDAGRYPPYTIHPLPPIEWSAQIPKRGDQRQMELWQRLGVYAAGLALDDAGMKGDEALCSTMDMTIAAAGGERDEAVDATILAAALSRNDDGVLLNEKLTTELRPTLFLAQLSNLLAGNISIVHKVTGSSRTFMGEESAGVAAIELAAARIRAGQSTHALVGASFQTEHPDMLLGYELAGYLHRDEWSPVRRRGDCAGGGVVTGSGAAFLVLESREHAAGRGRDAYAKIDRIASGRAERAGGGLAGAIEEMLARMAPPSGAAVLSGASGAHAATKAESAALACLAAPAARAMSTMTGHMKEAQFPFALALAALALKRGAFYPAFDEATEAHFSGRPAAVLATTIGYHHSEGMALLSGAGA